jgi:hypothetical protein
MTIDKRINYIGGGEVTDTYQGGSGVAGSAEAPKTSRRTVTSDNTGFNDRQSYNVNKNIVNVGNNKARKLTGKDYALLTRNNYNKSGFGGADRITGAGRFDEMYGSGLGGLFKTLFGFATGIPIGLFNKGKSGITSINNALGDFREKFTGYRTQQEYDDARQQRIDLNRINTIQNTLDTKYADGDYSMTDLDERLAALQQGLGIVPNTAAQNAQQFLDFSNQPELSYEGIKSLAQPETMTTPTVGSFGVIPERKPVPQYFENVPYQEPDFYSDAVSDAYTTPTVGQYGLNLMQLNTLKNAGYSNSQIEEAADKGYAEELVRDIEGPIRIL